MTIHCNTCAGLGRCDCPAVAGERAELTEQKVSQLTRKLRGASCTGLSEVVCRELSERLEAISIDGWENTPAGRSLLPMQPSRPSPPVRQIGGRSLAQATERLESRADIAMAAGDLEGFMDAKSAIGAAAAQEIGSGQLMNAFGANANATARLYKGSPSYSVDESDPGYQQAMTNYSQQMAAWNAKRDEANAKVTTEFNTKRRSVLRQLQIMVQEDQELGAQAAATAGETIYFVPNLMMYAR